MYPGTDRACTRASLVIKGKWGNFTIRAAKSQETPNTFMLSWKWANVNNYPENLQRIYLLHGFSSTNLGIIPSCKGAAPALSYRYKREGNSPTGFPPLGILNQNPPGLPQTPDDIELRKTAWEFLREDSRSSQRPWNPQKARLRKCRNPPTLEITLDVSVIRRTVKGYFYGNRISKRSAKGMQSPESSTRVRLAASHFCSTAVLVTTAPPALRQSGTK